MGLRSSVAKHMVESMPINVLVCDIKDMTIVYANKKSRETLDQLAGLLPKGVNGDTIVGQCIDVFHKNPQHQRRILNEKSNLPHRAVIRLGKEFLELQVMEIPGSIGDKGQLMLTWTVITAQERLKRMVDNMPINIIMADPDTLEIIFMNATSAKTLRSLEQYLPVTVDQVVGSCIDIFHKHPEHQRAMMADHKNLPHRAKNQAGNRMAGIKCSRNC